MGDNDIMKNLLILACFVSLLFGACGLLPEEEAPLIPPVAHVPEPQAMRTVAVGRGDVLLFTNRIASHIPARMETVRFTSTGQRIQAVTVTVGDVVSEGDVLALLDRPYLHTQLTEREREREWVLLNMTQLRERHDFELGLAEMTGIPVDDSRFIDERTRLNGELEVLEMRIAYLLNEIESTFIRSPFNGVISWALTISGAAWTFIGQDVATVVGEGQYVFRVSVTAEQAEEEMPPGSIHEITVDGEFFEAVVIEPQPPRIGAAETVDVYLHIIGEQPLIRPASFLQLVLVHEAARDALFLPNHVINRVGERTFVYVIEDGMPAVRDIEIGLTGSLLTEILSGLEEGEVVVL